MPGLWGSVGWFWYVPATVAYPFLIPLLVGFGLASLLPLEILRRYRNKWKKHTQDLNREFWTVADNKVEFFGTTATADEDWVRKFFGGKDEEQDKSEHGEYLPVGEGDYDDDEVMRMMMVTLVLEEMATGLTRVMITIMLMTPRMMLVVMIIMMMKGY